VFPLKDDIPTRRRPYVTVALIAANVAVYLLQTSIGLERSVYLLGLVPRELFTGQELSPYALVPPWGNLFTSMFSHGGLAHLGGNMLFLWIFGNNVEDDMGHGRFLAFYLLAGLAAAGAQLVTDPASTIPMVGASGAVAGVLGGYLLLYPHARVLALVPVFFFLRLMWIPAVVFLGLWFLLQILGIFGPSGGVAFWAHIGGFVAGLLLVRPFAGRIWRTDEEGGWRRMGGGGTHRFDDRMWRR
jgi:membrane associated rhomboid family serine protease